MTTTSAHNMSQEERVAVMEALRAGSARLEQLQAKDSFIDFCNTYMPDHFNKEFGKAQIELIETLEKCTNTNSRIVRAMPRDHGKTTILAAYCVWNIVTQRKRYIVYISDSADQAETVLADVKSELEENERILEDFGDLKTRKKWGLKSFVTSTGVQMVAKGARASMRGIKNKQFRPDLIVIDDLENDKNAETLLLRDKLHRWIRRAVLNMPSAHGDVVMIGTILHFDSVMQRILKDPAWDSKKISATDENGEPVWKAEWPKERLEAKQKEIGSEAYSQEYLNNPVDDKTKPFKKTFYQGYVSGDLLIPDGQGGRTRRFTTNFQTFDPAYSGSKRSHWAAIMGVGVDPENHWWILDMYRAHAEETENIKAFMAMQARLGAMKTGVETVFNQIYFKNAIIEEQRKRNQWFEVMDLRANVANKDKRIRGLVHRWEAGTIHIPEDHPLYTPFMTELYEYPHSKSDDMLDALAYVLQLTVDFIPPAAPSMLDSNFPQTFILDVDPETKYQRMIPAGMLGIEMEERDDGTWPTS